MDITKLKTDITNARTTVEALMMDCLKTRDFRRGSALTRVDEALKRAAELAEESTQVKARKSRKERKAEKAEKAASGKKAA